MVWCGGGCVWWYELLFVWPKLNVCMALLERIDSSVNCRQFKNQYLTVVVLWKWCVIFCHEEGLYINQQMFSIMFQPCDRLGNRFSWVTLGCVNIKLFKNLEIVF